MARSLVRRARSQVLIWRQCDDSHGRRAKSEASPGAHRYTNGRVPAPVTTSDWNNDVLIQAISRVAFYNWKTIAYDTVTMNRGIRIIGMAISDGGRLSAGPIGCHDCARLKAQPYGAGTNRQGNHPRVLLQRAAMASLHRAAGCTVRPAARAEHIRLDGMRLAHAAMVKTTTTRILGTD